MKSPPHSSVENGVERPTATNVTSRLGVFWEKIRELLKPQTRRPLSLVLIFFFFQHCSGFTAMRPYMVGVFMELGLRTNSANWVTVSTGWQFGQRTNPHTASLIAVVFVYQLQKQGFLSSINEWKFETKIDLLYLQCCDKSHNVTADFKPIPPHNPSWITEPNPYSKPLNRSPSHGNLRSFALNFHYQLHKIFFIIFVYFLFIYLRRSQWPRGLRRRSAAARLLRLWVRIAPGAWMSVVSVVCSQVEVSARSWSLVQRSPTDCGASLCVI
jgi:hypothetical protein